MTTSVRIAGDGDVEVVAALRRAWNEEQAGGPIDDPAFEGAFSRWWTAENGFRALLDHLIAWA